MIIPATIFRISGFLNKEKNTIEKELQDCGMMLCYSDEGKPYFLDLVSSKKETNIEDIKNYFTNKMNSVLKEKEILGVSNELSYIEDFVMELENKIAEKKANGELKEFKEIIAFKKEYTDERAKEIVINRRKIQIGTIIKTVVDIKSDFTFSTHKIGNSNIPVIRSKSLIFDQDGNPSTTGFYYYSQTDNAIPVSIIPAFNKEGEALNFFKVQLSKIATLNHFNHLVGHITRTIEKQLKEGSAIYVAGINYDYEKIKDNNELKALIKQIREISQSKDISIDKAKLYLELLNNLKDIVNQNPRLIVSLNIVFNLILSASDIKKILAGAKNPSPLVNLSKTLVNLNFSKENPSTKSGLSSVIDVYLKSLLQGEITGEILSIYHTPALRYGETSDSWGFMSNNIQVESFVLSMNDTIEIFKKLSIDK